MPAKNMHHDLVVRALKADGWTITHDPLTLSFGGRDLFVDLGAERAALAAESDRFGQLIISRVELRLLIFDETRERIVQWIEPKSTE
jgi:hypothetical protein